MIRSLLSLFSNDLAIDFGTHGTRVYAKGKGIMVAEPSILAVDKNSNVVAIGQQVLETLASYQDSITVIRPLKEGTITRLDLAEKLIQYCIQKAHGGFKWATPRAVIGVHPLMTDVERHAIESCVYMAKASEVYLVDAAIAAGEAATYDFAFIDADKTGYDAYYERCLVLLRGNGLIAIDNVLWGGDVAKKSRDADTLALQALNDKLVRDERIDIAMLPIGDGLTLALKR